MLRDQYPRHDPDPITEFGLIVLEGAIQIYEATTYGLRRLIGSVRP